MGPLDAFWHVANFFVPALGLGLLAPALAKLVWRRALRQRPWLELALWTAGAGSLVSIAGLLISGEDGRMLTYAAMVLAAASVLWWRGLAGGQRGAAE